MKPFNVYFFNGVADYSSLAPMPIKLVRFFLMITSHFKNTLNIIYRKEHTFALNFLKLTLKSQKVIAPHGGNVYHL